MKEFNTEGACIPGRHYMADTSAKLKASLRLVERGKYFIINRPRQYGKTTMLFALARSLGNSGEYLASSISFEGVGDEAFKEEALFCKMFLRLLERRTAIPDASTFFPQAINAVSSLEELSLSISHLAKSTPKKLVLLIDEVDKSSNNQLFVSFLGMLRNKYLDQLQGDDQSFHSVVLAGVHDVKTLKLKIRAGEEAKLNSPWNIAAPFVVDLALQPQEIVPMLTDYMQEQHVQMDATALAERLFYYTSGYPFLVSRLCQIMDEKIMPEKPAAVWEEGDVATAVSILVKENNTNFESLVKNLEDREELYKLVYDISVEGRQFDFNLQDTIIYLGFQYGIFKSERGVRIHNRVYEEVIFNFMISKVRRQMPAISDGFSNELFLPGKRLDMVKILLKFQAFMKEQYSKKDRDFLERHGRLVFLAFLKPIINGGGYDFKEPQISEERRLDVILTYFQHKYVAELKVWRGKVAHAEGLSQLADYLERQSLDEGYLVIFDHAEVKSWDSGWTTEGGKKVFMVWV